MIGPIQEWITSREAAERLGVQPMQLRGWLSDPVRAGFKLPKRWRRPGLREWPWPDLEQLFRAQRHSVLFGTRRGVGKRRYAWRALQKHGHRNSRRDRV